MEDIVEDITVSPNDEPSERAAAAGASAQPPPPEREQPPALPAAHAPAESNRPAAPRPQRPQRQESAPPNEFTFGWGDLEADEGTSLPARRKAGLPQAGGLGPAGLALAQQLAEQAARAPDRVGAAGLAAAAACLAAESTAAPTKRLRRALPHIVRAAAWVAWRLHPHPAGRNLLPLLPESVRRAAEEVCARAEEGGPLQTGWVATLLYRQAQQAAAERVAHLTAGQPSSPPPARNGKVRAGEFADSAAAEW